MNGIEALQVMKDGKIVKRTCCGQRLYRMVDGIVQYYDEGKWESSGADLNQWIERTFELSSLPVEYKLTFFEAMCEANKGYIVSSEAYPEYKYIMHDGTLYYYEKYGIGTTPLVAVSEMEAKWRVVEEEE